MTNGEPLVVFRRVYIAYLDSVNFFQPCHFRTMVYHELLIGYMDYVKGLGWEVICFVVFKLFSDDCSLLYFNDLVIDYSLEFMF